jgi:hypothetical protein
MKTGGGWKLLWILSNGGVEQSESTTTIWISSSACYRFTLVSCLAYSSTLKKEVTCSSETSVAFRRTTRLCIPEDGTVELVKFVYLNVYTYIALVSLTEQNFN